MIEEVWTEGSCLGGHLSVVLLTGLIVCGAWYMFVEQLEHDFEVVLSGNIILILFS